MNRVAADFITPTPMVFKERHFGVPAMDTETWTLAVEGLVRKRLALGLSDLEQLPHVEVIACHECAGSPLRPHLPQRKAANVKWRGVPLRAVLEAAGVHEDARYLLSSGADGGTWQHAHHPAYEKDLPLAKALHPATLLATAMNDKPLPVGHGGPVRLVVPGWYGTNSTKWLRSLRLSARRSESAFARKYYVDRETVGNTIRETPVWAMEPNSIIVAPVSDQTAGEGAAPVEIWGWCWAEQAVARLDVSTDGGGTWTAAELAPGQDFAWQRFSLQWTPPGQGEYRILSRATDEAGRTQPIELRRNQIFEAKVRIRYAPSGG
ncbi:molybdopterin-dependent oxidoreductase [Glycomyces sp. MUSA5-2]|uniref:molybdopterin-dependent oxidoreductase n=1 Tax=Glycomyces sp. MUSA5-2 TaxID=2053002 RepID=UPI00300813FC